MSELTQEYLKSRLHYDKDTGIFTWKTTRSNRLKVGQQAGTLSPDGYVIISIDYKRYVASRLVMLYVEGICPNFVDHRDTDRQNNRYSNLRTATMQENNCNTIMYNTNTSGIKGLSWCKRRLVWRAYVTKQGDTYRKDFKSKELAEIWVINVRNQLHGEFANHG